MSSVVYHLVREGVLNDECRKAYIETSDNPPNMSTKILPLGMNHQAKVIEKYNMIYIIKRMRMAIKVESEDAIK